MCVAHALFYFYEINDNIGSKRQLHYFVLTTVIKWNRKLRNIKRERNEDNA